MFLVIFMMTPWFGFESVVRAARARNTRTLAAASDRPVVAAISRYERPLAERDDRRLRATAAKPMRKAMKIQGLHG
jgi:hypothetical protein